MSTFALRPYQRNAIDCAWTFLRNRQGNPCIVIPTAGGKTIVMAEMIREALTTWPGTRIAVLAHVRELVSQNAEKLRRYWPQAPIGIYSASLNRRDRFEPVIFASIQSVANKAMQLGRFDLLLIDEAHRIPLQAEGQYRQFIEDCRRANPTLRICGLTATPYRLGGGPVCAPEHVLTDVAYEARVGDLIRQGYLCRLVSRAGAARADLSDVHIRNGEYVGGELERACDVAAVVAAACDEIAVLCADRHALIVFTAGINHAAHVAEALVARGVNCAVVDSKTPTAERTRRIEAFQRGELRALINVNVLSEGFDATHVDAVILMRPTKSAGLYYQQVGRGLRLHPGKANCLVLDFANNIIEHGPIDAIRPPKRPGERAKSDAPVRECPSCHAFVLAQARVCPTCAYQFPYVEQARHDGRASDAAILSDDAGEPVLHDVNRVTYSRHDKLGSKPSMRVTYTCGMRTFREWVCIEHGGVPGAHAAGWWMRRDTTGLMPARVEDALAVTDRLRIPTTIGVLESGRYPEIVSHGFAERTPDAASQGGNAGEHAPSAGVPGESAGGDSLQRLRGISGWLLQQMGRGGAGSGAADGLS